RITFDKSRIVGQPQAELVAPGHPLLDTAVDIILERFEPLLSQGAILVDDTDVSDEPRLLVYFEHAIRDGRPTRTSEPRVISQRLQFINQRYLAQSGHNRTSALGLSGHRRAKTHRTAPSGRCGGR